jgi:uncharacterized membrane protein YhhN
LLIVIPIIFAILAWKTLNLWMVEGVAICCAAICILVIFRQPGSALIWLLCAAFLISVCGDLCMKHRRVNPHLFIAGIAFFFVAHVCFLVFLLKNGGFSWPLFLIVLIPLMVFFAEKILKGISKPELKLGVLLYLAISCATLSASFGLAGGVLKPLFICGVASLAVSDFFISLREFMHAKAVCGWIMPLYYLAHILIAGSVLFAV